MHSLQKLAQSAQLSSVEQTAIREWLIGQLGAQEHAKLEQGGHTKNQIALRRVFVDLPVCDRPSGEYERDDRNLFLTKLLLSNPLTFKSSFKTHSGMTDEETLQYKFEKLPRKLRQGRRDVNNLFAANLLVGGPGQGKSTLGQFASQIHRAALLDAISDELTYAQRTLVASFKPRTESQEKGLWPKMPLLPIQIALPDLSSWLAKDSLVADDGKTGPAILRFMSELPSARAAKIGTSLFQKIIRGIPLLLIFDGFDEVGASEDRKRIVSAIRELTFFLETEKASAQIIATTRPQGYAGELEHIGVHLTEHYLVPLLRHEALEYAKKLLEAKISGPDERERMLGRLQEAASDSATARLLTTPLQVTILAALIQQIGRAPRERWNLFYRYFSYTYDREIERETYASPLLATFRPQIEQIHARVGLLLQVEAERDGGASARMPKEKLLEVINAVLSEDEFAAEEQERLAYEIAVAAGNRLVFLVEPEPNAFGFEIRSLQEFMSAWAITTGRDVEVEQRVRTISGASIFRNVMLFVASRFYSEANSLRDVIADNICPELDEGTDESRRFTRAGASLALEVLEEGAVLSQPKRARSLMIRAVGLLDLPASRIHHRLAQAISPDTVNIVYEAIEEILSNNKIGGSKYSAWVCLVELVNRGEDLAVEIANAYWEKLPHRATLIRELIIAGIKIGSWVLSKVEENSAEISPNMLISMQNVNKSASSTESWASWFTCINDANKSRYRRGAWHCTYIAEHDFELPQEPDYDAPDAWLPYINYLKFESAPSAVNLALALESVAIHQPFDNLSKMFWNMSWPIKASLDASKNPSELLAIARRLKENSLGDAAEWRRSQADWLATDFGVLLSDSMKAVPWSLESLAIGPPLITLPVWTFIHADGDVALKTFNRLKEMRRTCRIKPMREWLALAALCMIPEMPQKPSLEMDDLQSLLEEQPSQLGILVPKPKAIMTALWTQLLEQNPGDLDSRWTSSPEAVFRGLTKRKYIHPLLLTLAVRTIEKDISEFSDDVDLENMVGLLNRIVPKNEKEMICINILKVYCGNQDCEFDEWIVKSAVKHSDDHIDYIQALVYAIYARRIPEKRQVKLLLELFEIIEDDDDLLRDVVALLRSCMGSQKTGLSSPAIWTSLGFSNPTPANVDLFKNPKSIFTLPIWLERIELRNIGRFNELTLNLPAPNFDKGQWIVILGQNGAGKSTILRSVVMALRNVKDPSIWPSKIFGREWIRLENSGDTAPIEGQIKLTMAQGNVYITDVRRASPFTFLQIPEHHGPRQIPIFAYGCRRGSAMGGMNRDVDLSDGMEIATLVDDNASLIHAETWLKDLDGDANRNDLSKSIFDAVINAMCNLLAVERIWIENKKVWVIEKDGIPIGFSEMSDGYLTSAGWFVDLIARWIDFFGSSQPLMTGNFLKNMTGLVLIDEIDLHLHPKWQIEIIGRTRDILPKMSFIVTTHNPLTLVGARAGEIWNLTENSITGADPGKGAPLLLTGGQLYSRYFEIHDIYPSQIGRAVQRLNFLSGIDDLTREELAEISGLLNLIDKAELPSDWFDISDSIKKKNGDSNDSLN